jgi:hypothetical protein
MQQERPDFGLELHPARCGAFVGDFRGNDDFAQKKHSLNHLAVVAKTENVGRNILPTIASVYFPHPGGTDKNNRQGMPCLAERLQNVAAKRRDRFRQNLKSLLLV